VLALARADPTIKVAFGCYPLYLPGVRENLPDDERTSEKSKRTFEETIAQIEAHAEKIVAIGEVGIDGKDSDDLDTQAAMFRELVRLSMRIRRPLIIHSRKAESLVLDILEQEKCTRAVMHCFCGRKSLIDRGVKLGLTFSIPTSVVRNDQFKLLAALVPTGQLLIETDAPYQGPYKDLRNEPANIRDAIPAIAEQKRMDPIELANAVYFNYQKLFL
jgi:TatD DNase family protein